VRYVKGIVLQVGIGTRVLQSVERDFAVLPDCDDLAVKQRVRQEVLTSASNFWEPGGETVASSGAVRSLALRLEKRTNSHAWLGKRLESNNVGSKPNEKRAYSKRFAKERVRGSTMILNPLVCSNSLALSSATGLYAI
jgi:hypothetical protein